VVFEVALGANKYQIRQAIEKLFSVDVREVNTAIMKGKPKRFGRTIGRRANWKKAIVVLGEGQQIDFYPSEEEITE
jgi:large subunit ribosomal protein L23